MDISQENTIGLLTSTTELASWARERTVDELRGFVNHRHSLLPDDIEVE